MPAAVCAWGCPTLQTGGWAALLAQCDLAVDAYGSFAADPDLIALLVDADKAVSLESSALLNEVSVRCESSWDEPPCKSSCETTGHRVLADALAGNERPSFVVSWTTNWVSTKD